MEFLGQNFLKLENEQYTHRQTDGTERITNRIRGWLNYYKYCTDCILSTQSRLK